MVPRTARRYEDLSPAARRRVVVISLLRCQLTVGVLVTIYYLVPVNRLLDADAAVGLLAGLVGFAGSIVWEVGAISRSTAPRLRAIQTLAVALPLFLLLFALTYVVLATNQAASFTVPLSRTDALYFTVTVFSTVGFGDITPRTELARILVTAQMVVDLIVVGVVAKVIFGAVEVSVRRIKGGAPDTTTR